jgi:copper oxidase (laccase) domain-containing protein
MGVPAGDLMAWLGPAIGPAAFEVGDEVRAAFVADDPAAAAAFRPAGPAGKWLADLYLLARQRLAALGVAGVYGGDACTFTEPRASFPTAATAGRAAWPRWSGLPEFRRGPDRRYTARPL